MIQINVEVCLWFEVFGNRKSHKTLIMMHFVALCGGY